MRPGVQEVDNEQIRSRPFPRDREAMRELPVCLCALATFSVDYDVCRQTG